MFSRNVNVELSTFGKIKMSCPSITASLRSPILSYVRDGCQPLPFFFNRNSCLPSPGLKLTEQDRIAVMFCGSQKTLAFGIPLIKVKGV